MIFPKFAGIVKENPGEKKINVQLGIERTEGKGHTHHLRSVLNQSAAAGVVIISRGGSAPKAITKILQE